MTINEARTYMQNKLKALYESSPVEAFSKDADAYYLAIEALEELKKNETKKELCDDCISREKTMQIVRKWFDRDAKPSELKNAIEQMPSVQPEQKTGRWELDRFDDGETVRCSECKEYYTHERKYCPNCGAKMEVEE